MNIFNLSSFFTLCYANDEIEVVPFEGQTLLPGDVGYREQLIKLIGYEDSSIQRQKKRLVHGRPRHPQSQGCVERGKHNFKKILNFHFLVLNSFDCHCVIQDLKKGLRKYIADHIAKHGDSEPIDWKRGLYKLF